MQGTRERVLDYIVRNREARVEDLADALEITSAAVRRHLDNLRADGLVEARAVKQAMGRPYYAYHATEQGMGTMPAAYADLLERMLRSLGERDDVIAGVMTNVAEALAARHRDELVSSENDAPETRIDQVTVSLRQEGILDRWHAGPDGFHLLNGTCPYLKAAELSPLPCESDRRAIELLVGLDVEQLNRIVDGSPVCEYLVRSAHGPHDLIQVS
jgi:DeoR family transcriptional regulator, suf operon transcriptional repressor